jgi:hypothetical protein
VTLLPRHAPSSGAKSHPCVRNTVLPISQEGHSRDPRASFRLGSPFSAAASFNIEADQLSERLFAPSASEEPAKLENQPHHQRDRDADQ